MKKKFAALALGCLLLGSGFVQPTEKAFAEVFNKSDSAWGEKVRTRETNTYNHVWIDTKDASGTLIIEVYPSKNSTWDPLKNPLKPGLRYLRKGYLEVNITDSSIVKKDEKQKPYLEIKRFISAPNKDFYSWFLHLQDGQFGYDPFDVYVNFIPGKDVTKQTPDVNKIVYWEGTVLLKGQIGRIKVLKPTNLWKRTTTGLQLVRVLKPGEQYRVYQYDNKYGGQYGLGGNAFITNIKGYVEYKTPSNAKLQELTGE